jgi:hypothetical protein
LYFKPAKVRYLLDSKYILIAGAVSKENNDLMRL